MELLLNQKQETESPENGGPVVQSDAGVGIGIGMGWGVGHNNKTLKRHKKGSQFHDKKRGTPRLWHFSENIVLVLVISRETHWF